MPSSAPAKRVRGSVGWVLGHRRGSRSTARLRFVKRFQLSRCRWLSHAPLPIVADAKSIRHGRLPIQNFLFPAKAGPGRADENDCPWAPACAGVTQNSVRALPSRYARCRRRTRPVPTISSRSWHGRRPIIVSSDPVLLGELERHNAFSVWCDAFHPNPNFETRSGGFRLKFSPCAPTSADLFGLPV